MNLKKAALINVIGKYSVVIMQLVVTAILSRILSVEDYGVIAVVTVFSTFFSTLSNMGFGTAIIQKKELNQTDIDNIYSFTVYVSLILAFIFAMFSFAIAWFYKDGLYIPVTMLLSISLFFNAVNMVPNGILNREKRFTVIAARTIIVYFCAAVIAIIFAKLGFRYYALVFQTILSAFLGFIWNFISTRPHFHIKVDMSSIRKVANYSSYQFAFNFVNYFAGNLDNLLTGKFFGHADLGYYNKAYNLSLYPVNNLAGVINPVFHPILSDYQSDKRLLYGKYIKVFKILALMGCYAEAICILASREIINVMFGSQWEQSVYCFHMLCLCVVFRMVNSCSGALFQSLDDTKRLFQNAMLNTGISIVAILVGIFVFKDIRGLSICVACAYVLHYCTASYMLITGSFSFSLLSYYKDIIREVVIFLIMTSISFIDFFTIQNDFLSLIVKVLYITVLYILLLLVTKEYRVLTSLVQKKKYPADNA